MAGKQEIPPPYAMDAQPQRGSKQRVLLGLMFYAGAVTAALVTVCVFGALYRQEFQLQTKQTNGAQSNDKAVQYYHKEDEDQEEDYQLDLNRNREVVQQTGRDGNVSLIVLDFTQDVGGIFSSALNLCAMIQDFEEDLPNTAELQRVLENHGSENNPDDDSYVDYYIDEEYYADLSRLPSELITPCWGKSVYTLVRDTEDSEERQKRRTPRKIKIKVKKDGTIKIVIKY